MPKIISLHDVLEPLKQAHLGGRFAYFLLFFFCSGEGKGESEEPGGGGRFSIENPRRGGGCLPSGWGRAEGVFAGNLGGGGAKYFFAGPKCPPRRLASRDSKARTP